VPSFGYGIHWNHPAGGAPHKRGDRVDHRPESVFGSSSFFGAFSLSLKLLSGGVVDLRRGPASAGFRDGIAKALMVSPVGTRNSPPAWTLVSNLFEESVKPNLRNMTSVLSVKRYLA